MPQCQQQQPLHAGQAVQSVLCISKYFKRATSTLWDLTQGLERRHRYQKIFKNEAVRGRVVHDQYCLSHLHKHIQFTLHALYPRIRVPQHCSQKLKRKSNVNYGDMDSTAVIVLKHRLCQEKENKSVCATDTDRTNQQKVIFDSLSTQWSHTGLGTAPRD